MLSAISDAQWRELFAIYNNRIWPMQIELYLVGVLAVVLAFLDRPWRRWIPRAVALSLAALWSWAGMAYESMFMSPEQPASWLLGGLLIVGAVALAWYGGIEGRISFRSPDRVRSVIGMSFVAYALGAQPVLVLLGDGKFAEMATFGLPGPVVLFTLGILVHADRPLSWAPLGVPLLWVVASVVAGAFGGVGAHTFALSGAAIVAVGFALRDQFEETRLRLRDSVPGASH